MTIACNFNGVLIFFILLNGIAKSTCKSHLSITNDGPAIIGANITFYARLSGYSTESPLTYVFDDGVQKTSFTSGNLNVSSRLAFPSEQYAEGQYCMNVTVLNPIIWKFEKKIAENYTYFNLKNSLLGEILVYQGNRSVNGDVREIAVGENFTAIVDIYDPNNYLKDAVIDYSWSFDMDHYFTPNTSVTYNFTDVGEKIIIVKPTATFPDSRSVSGFFYKKLIAKVPVKHLNITGNPFLHHGDFLKINVTCDGTPYFYYCFEIVKDNITIDDNFSCKEKTTFSTCHMEISRFLTDGIYQLFIYVANDVGEVRNVKEVKVYNASIKPALSTIIIPIVCSLLTLIIIAVGISLYIQQRNHLAIEIADFDFQDESDSYTEEKTFFEKIYDSLACRNCGKNQWSCVNNRSESDPLLNDDSLPYV